MWMVPCYTPSHHATTASILSRTALMSACFFFVVSGECDSVSSCLNSANIVPSSPQNFGSKPVLPVAAAGLPALF